MANKLKMAYDMRARLAQRIERIRTVAVRAGRDLNDDDKRDIEDIEGSLEIVGREIHREEEILEAEKKAIVFPPLGSEDRWPGQLADGFRLGRGPLAGATKGTPRFSALFPDVQLSTEEWPSYSDFLNTIHAGVADPRLTAMVEGSGPEGGWLVPTQYAAELLDAAMANPAETAPWTPDNSMLSEQEKADGF